MSSKVQSYTNEPVSNFTNTTTTNTTTTTTHKPKNSAFTRLRKAQSTPKLRNYSPSPSNQFVIPSSKKKKIAGADPEHLSTKHKLAQSQTQAQTHTHTQTHTNTKKSITLSAPKTSSNKNSIGFFKRISNEWNSFLHKLKSVSEETFNDEHIVDDLFTESDLDDLSTLDKLIRSSKGYNSTEEKFLQDYKKFKSLDNMYAHYNHNNNTIHQPNSTLNDMDLGSSTTIGSDQTNLKLRHTLQDVIRQQASNYQFQNIDEIDLDEEEEDEEAEESGDQEDADARAAEYNGYNDALTNEGAFPAAAAAATTTSSSASASLSNTQEIIYHDIDFALLRKEFEAMLASTNPSSDSDTNSRTTSATRVPQQQLNNSINVGSTLWDYRRQKWLQPKYSTKRIKERIAKSSISHIPKESFPKIYENLVDKNKALKSNKKLNLADLIKIINAGWIAEERWERAARGLA